MKTNSNSATKKPVTSKSTPAKKAPVKKTEPQKAEVKKSAPKKAPVKKAAPKAEPVFEEAITGELPVQNKKILQANTLSKSAKSSMLTRVLSAVIGLLIIIPTLFLGDWIYFSLITIALLIACWEILGCANKRTFVIFVIYFIFVGLLVYWPIFRDLLANNGLTKGGKIDSYYTSIYLSVLVVVIGIFFLFFLTVIYKDFTVQDAAFLIAMGVLIGLGFQSLFYLRYYPLVAWGVNGYPAFTFTKETTIKPSLLIIFAIIGTFMTDTGAYFVGVFFGKNKMNERISPKKTWEGFVGGIVISFIISSTLGIVLGLCNYPILPNLDMAHWYNILILSLIIPLFATLGDFVFSAIKRYWGIKDYGKLIPGHGGVLDRLDSIFFAAIIVAIFVFMLSVVTETGELNWGAFLV